MALDWCFRWLVDGGYGRRRVDTYLAGVKAFWRYATALKLVPPSFSYDAMRNGLRQVMGRQEPYHSPRINRPGLVDLVVYA